jgi:hypothetical protein
MHSVVRQAQPKLALADGMNHSDLARGGLGFSWTDA